MITALGPIVFYLIGIVVFFTALSGRIKWALCYVIFLAPLRNVIEKIHEFPFGKDFLDILIIVMILGWILGALAGRRAIFEKSAINFAAILLILYTTFSLWKGYFYLHYYDFFNALDPRVQDWKNFCMLPILFFLTLNTINDRKWIERIIVILSVSMLLVGYYTVRQISDFSVLVSREKINGTFVYLGPNEVAAFYSQFTILLISVFFGFKKGIKKIFLLGLICVGVYCIVFLFSRAAYLAFVVALFLLLLFRKPLYLIPLLAVLICWQTVLPSEVKTRIEMTTTETGQLDASAENRLVVWQQSIELFKSDPIFGVGFGVFRYMGFQLGDTHNIYLKILAEQGIIGFFVFLILIFAFFREGWKLFRRGEDELARSLGFGFLMCLVALLINNLFGDRWTYFQLSAYLWVFAALVSRLNAGVTPVEEKAISQDKKQQ